MDDKILSRAQLFAGDPRNKRLDVVHLQEDVADIRVSTAVPEDVRHHLGIAKRVFIAGYFYYELFTVAVTYCALACEVALRERLNEPKSNLVELIKDADAKSLLGPGSRSLIDSMRELRNKITHGERMILTPAMALDVLHSTAALVNDRFPEPPRQQLSR